MDKLVLASVAGLAAIASLFTTTAARANATFDYVGTPFAMGTIGGTQAPLQDVSVYGSSLDGMITFDGTVTGGFTGTVTSTDVLSWSLSAGPTTLSSSAGSDTLVAATFTFMNGTMTAWDFEAEYSNGGDTYVLYTDYNVVNTGFFEDASLIYTISGPTGNLNNSNYSSNGVGTWTGETSSTPAPEPASLALLGSGLLGFRLIRRRRS